MKAKALTRVAFLSLLALLFSAPGALASVISYDVTGVDAANNPVSGRIDFATGSGFVTVDLNNLLAASAVKEIGQNVFGVQFTLTSGQSSGSLGSNSPNFEQTVAAGGASGPPSMVTGNPTGWSLQSNVNKGLGPGLALCVLCAGGNGPHTIIGGSASSTYGNADGSIAGSVADNPFFISPLHFSLNVTGLTSNDNVDSVFITFGTTTLQAHCSILSCITERHKTPEPSSLLMLGVGLLGLAGYGLRKRLHTK